ncbi:enoyl-CoA hydratase/isomerase family protein [Chelativorans sp.]|uniref:enoyl-CoA hydratase/isomerase family protein n=1 Tax=Chelativorans sp. TaxID=2203393 RepID=UPI002810DBC3|nr:enoyl-CoA hydratase/isomerase family protein [Chelativorans sp.]
MTEDVLIASRGAALEITLNRPDNGNALTAAMAEAITAALKGLAAETRVVLLKANGADFCTGRSAAMPVPGSRATALDLRAAISEPVLDFYEVLREIPVPFVAAVRGRAAGVGCALAALADVAIAAETAVFQVPEMNHDIAPTLVMNALADRVPRAALARLVLTRDPVSAAEAKTLGLIGMAVPDSELEEDVARIVGQLEKNSVPVVRGIKAFLSLSPETSFASRKELAALINSSVTAERYR